MLSVPEIVNCKHAVVFDEERSFAVNKQTGRVLELQRNGKGWDLTVELEVPNVANKVNQEESVRRLAELKQKEEEAKNNGFEVLKGILEQIAPHAKIDAAAWTQVAAATQQVDPTVYPFGRQR